jgi:hypothetical protein
VLERGCSEMQLLPPPLGSPRFARGTAQGFGSPCMQVGLALLFVLH